MTELHDCCDAPLVAGDVDRHAEGALADDVVRHAAGAALAAIARRRPRRGDDTGAEALEAIRRRAC
jgi:hypothetical protein